MLALLLKLGLWQAGKGERLAADLAQRAQRAQHGAVRVGAARVDPEALQDAPITVRGRYEPQQQIFLDNRQEEGVPGVHVITPLKIEGSDMRILVNRGWVGWSQGRKSLPAVATPEGLVQVSGVAALPVVKHFLLMPEHAEPRAQLWMQLDLKRFEQEAGYAVQPVLLLQDAGAAPDGLTRHWQPPEDRVAKHQSYSLQWFGMAFALLVFYAVASVHREQAA